MFESGDDPMFDSASEIVRLRNNTAVVVRTHGVAGKRRRIL